MKMLYCCVMDDDKDTMTIIKCMPIIVERPEDIEILVSIKDREEE